MTAPIQLSAAEQARQVKARRLSARALTEAHLARIAAVDDRINAFLRVDRAGMAGWSSTTVVSRWNPMGKRRVETRNPVDGLVLNTGRTMNTPRLYEIRVLSHLSANWAARFEGLSMWHEPGGTTALSGMLDQAALHGVFVKIRDLGLYLISVNPIKTAEPNNAAQ